MMLVISSERMAIGWDLLEGAGARDELVPQALEPAPDAAIDQAVADPDDQAPDQVGVDLELEVDTATGHLLEPGGDCPNLVLGQWRGARRGGDRDALACVVEATELGSDARQLMDPAAPEHEPDQVEHRAADDLAERRLGQVEPGLLRDGRVAEQVR